MRTFLSRLTFFFTFFDELRSTECVNRSTFLVEVSQISKAKLYTPSPLALINFD